MGLLLPERPDAELVVVLDCLDLDLVASFWTAALGYRHTEIAEPFCSVLPPDGEHGVELLLQRVSDAKAGKNRMHLDIRVGDLDVEVARLNRLGARTLTDAPNEESGWTWHVLADPEHNEFCVLEQTASS